MKLGLRISLIAGVFAALLTGSGSAWARDDWNLWQEAVFPVYKNGRYEASLIEHTRFRDDFSDIFFTQAKIKNLVKLTKHFSAALNYSFIEMKDARNHWQDEHRPELELYPGYAIGDWAFENRNRTELRLIEGSSGQEEIRNRNRWQATYTIPLWERQWKVFANEEVFYDFSADEWNQNRAFAGFTWTPNKTFKASLSWGVQSIRRGGDWEDRQLLYAVTQISL